MRPTGEEILGMKLKHAAVWRLSKNAAPLCSVP